MKKDWIARELTMEVVVGVFIFMIFLGLGYFTIILSRETWFGDKTELNVDFENVMGLREGDSVVARGMPVGKVRKLDLDGRGVTVTASLDEKLDMRRDYRITIVATSILGGRHMQVDEGSADEPRLPMDTVFKGDRPYDLIGDAAELVHASKKGLVDGGVISNLVVSAGEIRDVINRIHRGEGALGRLLSDDETLYDDLAAGAAALRRIVERLDAGDGTLGRLLSSDDTVYRDLSATVGSLRKVSERLEKGEGTIGRLMAADETLYEDLSAAAASLRRVTEQLENGEGPLGRMLSGDGTMAEDLEATAASLRRITARIENGEGMLGRLVQDDELYNEVREVIDDVRATIDDYREQTPVVTFTSIFFGAF